MTKQQNEASGDSGTTNGKDNTDKKAADVQAADGLDITRPLQQGVTHSQDQNSGPTKPSEKGSDPTTKIIIGLGILLLFMAFGPLILPEMVGMGAIGSAVMAAAGVGLLAYGASELLSNTKESPSTSNPSRQQMRSGENPQQSSQQSPQQSPAAVNDLTPIIKALSNNNTVPTSDVDAQRENLMNKLALSQDLKDMVKNNSTDDENFKKNFDIQLKKFFKNMGEETKSKEGMGNQFLKKVNEEDSEENIAFNTFKENMMALLIKDQVPNKSKDALIAENEALETAITTIDELKQGNRSRKEELDNFKDSFGRVEPGKKIEADKERLENLSKANEKISKANTIFEGKKTAASPSPPQRSQGNGR